MRLAILSGLGGALMGLVGPAPADAATETVLYSFPSLSMGDPQGGLVADAGGNLFGTLSGGRTDTGAIFKLSPSGAVTFPYLFPGGMPGASPTGRLLPTTAGNLFGTSLQGGGLGFFGTVFKLAPSGLKSVVATFPTSGIFGPIDGVIADGAGNLLGVADTGGKGSAGCGGIFKIGAGGGLTTLYEFPGGGQRGCEPRAGLFQGANGTLFGTTFSGGLLTVGQGAGFGTVFKLFPGGKQVVLHAFRGLADGAFPLGRLVSDRKGNLFGTSFGGFGGGFGTVFRVTPNGAFSTLYAFKGGVDGANPTGGLTLDAAGDLYGATAAGGAGNRGTIFKITPQGGYTVVYAFAGGSKDGASPVGDLLLDTSGALLGVTAQGGTTDNGTIFKLVP